MRTSDWRSAWILGLLASLAAGQLIDDALSEDGQLPSSLYADSSCKPTINLNTVPQIGSFDQVEGSVQLPSSDQSFADYKVVLYIHITSPLFYGWVVKPGTGTAKVTNIQSDGSFSVQYATGGIDDEADRMIAYLVPSASVLDMPETVGAPLEEDVISQYAVAYASAVRGPTASVFSGASYHKKSGVFDPGPANFWSLEDEATSVQPSTFNTETGEWETGPLQLSVQYRCDDSVCGWHCTEQVGIHSYGYGTYHWSVRGRTDLLQESLVLGLFTYEFPAPENLGDPNWGEREIDFEFAQWSGPEVPKEDNFNLQNVVQPFELGYLQGFNLSLASEDDTVHCIFKWTEGAVTFETHVVSEGSSTPVLAASYSASGSIVPTPGVEHVHMNMWIAKWTILGLDNQYNPIPPNAFQDGDRLHADITAFKFSPVENDLREFYPKPINPGRCEDVQGMQLCIAQGVFLSSSKFDTQCASDQGPDVSPGLEPSPPDQPEMPTKTKFKSMIDKLCAGKTIVYMEELESSTLYYGSAADECIVGTAKDDTIFGGGGNDLLVGGRGQDHLFGDSGADTLLGNGGKDTLFGLGGADSLNGGKGSDVLLGGKGKDTIRGCLDQNNKSDQAPDISSKDKFIAAKSC